VADHTECTAIHPGYGFFSEDFRFARRVTVRDRPLTFIGRGRIALSTTRWRPRKLPPSSCMTS
jgi:acetyl/propionyl-CoA carboxylase alpha subunit